MMAEFSKSIEELRDPDVLEFYIDELVGEEDVERIHRRKQVEQSVARDSLALLRLAEGYGFINQYEALGLDQPTSFFAELNDLKIVVNVLSPSRAQARIIDPEEDLFPQHTRYTGSNAAEVSYKAGSWRKLTMINETKVWQNYSHYVSNEPVKIVGLIGQQRLRSVESVSDIVNGQLSAVVRNPQLDWANPDNCWFLSQLQFTGNPPASVGGLVLYQAGKFAVTGALLGTTAMKRE